jgi:hypothetical protein
LLGVREDKQDSRVVVISRSVQAYKKKDYKNTRGINKRKEVMQNGGNEGWENVEVRDRERRETQK